MGEWEGCAGKLRIPSARNASDPTRTLAPRAVCWRLPILFALEVTRSSICKIIFTTKISRSGLEERVVESHMCNRSCEPSVRLLHVRQWLSAFPTTEYHIIFHTFHYTIHLPSKYKGHTKTYGE